MRNKKNKEYTDHTLNIWNGYDFAMAGIGERFAFFGRLKHFAQCIKWSRQRIFHGYADCDVWSIYDFLQMLMPEMLQDLKDRRHGSPAFLGEIYTNEEGYLVNDTCHEEWDKILDRMIFLWREIYEDTCSKKNPYEDEYMKAFSEFCDKYGFLGQKLQTPEELENNKIRGGGGTMHSMDELPEYKEIYTKHYEEDKKLEEYRSECKDKAIDMLKEYFFCLWD